MNEGKRAVIIGNYSHTRWGWRSTRGRVFDKDGIAPCICDYSGGGPCTNNSSK